MKYYVICASTDCLKASGANWHAMEIATGKWAAVIDLTSTTQVSALTAAGATVLPPIASGAPVSAAALTALPTAVSAGVNATTYAVAAALYAKYSWAPLDPLWEF